MLQGIRFHLLGSRAEFFDCCAADAGDFPTGFQASALGIPHFFHVVAEDVLEFSR